MTEELLTADELVAIATTANLWNMLTKIVGDGPSRDGDLDELIGHVHAIQHAVMANAAARAYPLLLRPLGGDMPDGVITGAEINTDGVRITADGVFCQRCGQPLDRAPWHLHGCPRFPEEAK